MKLRMNLFALLLPVLASAQLSDTDFEGIYAQLSEHAQQIPYIGHKEGQTNPFTEEFTRLAWNFSDDDLMYIAQNGNTVLKASAGNELVSRKSPNLTALFSEELFSKEIITVNSGNVGNDYSLAAALYKEIAFQKEKKQRKHYYEKTSTPEQLRGLKELFGDDFDSKWSVQEADSLMTILTRIALSNDDISAETLGQIFRINQYRSNEYARVKFFASKYPTQEILATLASFKNKNDLQLLRQHLNDAYIAISLFPHPSLLAYLKTNLDTDFQNPEYQQAIAAYRNQESKNALETICNKITTIYHGSQRDEKLFALHGIIEKINCPLYSDLLLKLEKNI